jgi:hypothetical protein
MSTNTTKPDTTPPKKRYIGKTQSDNALLMDALQDKVDRIIFFLDDEEAGEYDQIIASE